MEITFKDVSAADQIVIRTKNSEYQFSVVDPSERRGMLSGGSLGDHQRDATLVGSLHDKGIASDSTKLEQGARALFYLSARNGIERLITSAITEIDHIRNRSRNRRAA
jgi:hypothetical protein